MRELLLVRHGIAHCNAEGVVASTTCRGLTPQGRHQAEQLATRLRMEQGGGRPVVQLHCSPVRRARETAETIAAHLAVEPTVDQDLRVPDLGPLGDGQRWAALRQQWSPDPDRPSRPLPDGGEPWRQYLDRAHACLSSILNGHPGGRVVLVGHSETVTAAFTLLLAVRSLGALKIDIEPTGITTLVAATEHPNVPASVQRWALSSHNDITHATPSHNAFD